MISTEILEDLIYTNPLALSLLKDKEDIDKANSYLPYSTGFELECFKKSIFNIETFKTIPDILDINCNSDEQRYRIPNGIVGLICLYNISQQLKINSELNLGSGVHYHVDCTDCYSLLEDNLLIKNKDYILKELDTWDYKGTYNKKGLNLKSSSSGAWLRTNQLQTLEFRIGEMTFDYSLLAKRIIHCNKIVKCVKDQILVNDNHSITYIEPDYTKLLKYYKSVVNNANFYVGKLLQYQRTLEDLKKQQQEQSGETPTEGTMECIRDIIKDRVHKIN